MMDGDQVMVDKFIALFKEQVKNQLPLMRAYLESGNYSLLANSAHIMKTQTAYLGLKELYELAHKVESLADEGRDIQFLSLQAKALDNQLTTLLETELK